MLTIFQHHLKQAGLRAWVEGMTHSLKIDFAHIGEPALITEAAMYALDDEQIDRVTRRIKAMILGMRLANVLEQACEPPPGPTPNYKPAHEEKDPYADLKKANTKRDHDDIQEAFDAAFGPDHK